MTDERPDSTAPGAGGTPPDQIPEEPSREDAASYETSAEDPGRDEPPAGARIYDDADAPADAADTAAADEAAEPEDDGRRRPPLAIIIGSVLLLAVIGAGLAFLLPSGPVREADQLIPSSPPVTGQPAAETGGQATVPTALPLPEATGEYSSTEVIVQIGEGGVTRGDFVRQYQPGQDPAELLNQLIQIELVVQEAAAEGVTGDAAAVEEQVAQIKASQAGGDDAQFALFLDQARVGNEDNLRRLLERDSILEQMILRHTTAEQARARHILLATDATTDTAQLDQVKTEAEALLADIEGGADFAALAAERSDDPGSKETGGDLGWAPRGLFVGPFDEAVFSMKAGERRLVQTQFGWHIIELVDEPVMRPFESADLLQTPPGQQAFAESFIPWIDELQKQAEADNRITIVVPAEQLVTPAGS